VIVYLTKEITIVVWIEKVVV